MHAKSGVVFAEHLWDQQTYTREARVCKRENETNGTKGHTEGQREER